MTDPTPLTEEERGLVETVAKALGKLGVCPTKNSGSPWEALSRTQQIDLTTISETAVSATRDFYSERERALREMAALALAELGPEKGADALRRQVIRQLRAALGPTDPAPSTTEGGERKCHCGKAVARCLADHVRATEGAREGAIDVLRQLVYLKD